jgi:hypothetical protein
VTTDHSAPRPSARALITVNEAEIERLREATRAGRVECALPACSVLFVPRHGKHRYCCARHRKAHRDLLWLAEHPKRLLSPEELQASREAGFRRASETLKAHWAYKKAAKR